MNPTTRPTINPTMAPRSNRGARPTPAGWIYLIHTVGDPRMYVGQTSRPPWARIREHRRSMDWGGEILPGREGYTILRRVDTTGNPTIDAILLDLAEAEEIRRLDPTDNRYRPDPAIFRARLAAAQLADRGGDPWGPIVGPTTTTPTITPRRPRGVARTTTRGVAPRDPWAPLRAVMFMVLSAASIAVGWPLAQAWPHPAAPWVIVPVAAVLGPVGAVHLIRKTFGKPRRKRKRRRR